MKALRRRSPLALDVAAIGEQAPCRLAGALNPDWYRRGNALVAALPMNDGSPRQRKRGITDSCSTR